ncbi:hypothetical protein Chor_005649 [Crotalus horridus]
MNINSPSPKGLTEAHRRYSFLQTASEGLDQNESDSESLVEEAQYQWELQRRICETQERVSWAYEKEADDRMEKDSLEDMCLSEEESHGEETQRPSGDQDERRNPENESSQDSIVDEYSELRYDPNWKDSQKGKSFLQLEDSHQEELRNFSVTSRDLACSPSQGKLLFKNCQGSPQNISSATDGEFWKPSGDKPGDGRDRPFRLDKKGRKTGVLYHYGSNDSLASSGCRVHFKEPKPRPEKDFIEKNKHTLGLATQQNSSYLRLHGKKQRGGCQEKIIVLHKDAVRVCTGFNSKFRFGFLIHWPVNPTYDAIDEAHQSARRPPMDGVSSSQAASLQVTPLSKRSTQPPLGTQVELRSQPSGGNNLLELENVCPDSTAYRETSEVQQDSRCAPHCELYPPACLSIANHSSEDSPLFSGQAPYLLQHHAKKRSMNLAFAGTPLQRSSYHNFPGFPSPCAGEKCQPGLENISGLHHPYFYRCTVSEPFPSHGKRWIPLGHKRVSYAHDGGQKEPVNGAVASGEPCHIYTEEIPNNYAFDYSGSSQPPAPPPVKRTLSPTARLIQAVERHHRELSQLADDHLARNQLASMFPPIIQRGESDSQLHLESGEETQPVLSRSNSEGYLLQMEKQKERRGKKGHRKGSRAKGYVKMDVRLGGLGPDYETIKEKALEYAKTIPKPRLFVSRSSEQETKEEKNLARTLNGENLPPISSLESLQNRHEKEKQVVAAFKTLHIV